MVWLIGCGNMGHEYANVLLEMDISFITIGRGEIAAKSFNDKTGCNAITGGLKRFLENFPDKPSSAIVAVGVESLYEATSQLIKYGINHILLEKPGGLDAKEITDLNELSIRHEVNVYIAYNRRFYSSVKKAKDIIEKDGGLISFNFEFTELTRKIEKLKKEPGIKEHWFLGNSSHVVDLAFHLGGIPKTISTYHQGSLDWHPSASIFSGSGVSKTGALFSYNANWHAPGRWGVELLTNSNRLKLEPLEQLDIQRLGSFNWERIEIEDRLDKKYKPGVYNMVQTFLQNDTSEHCNLTYQSQLVKLYYKIANYS